MRMKTLLGDKVMVIPDDSDERTQSGLIIPQSANSIKNPLKAGVIAKKGTGTPWNTMDDVHLKDRVLFKRGSGMVYEEENDGHTATYLILNYSELLFV